MDIFDEKSIDPMLIAIEDEAFDDKDYIYELKMDGVRCIAYIDTHKIEFRNKRHLNLSAKFPELKNCYKNVKKKCILDGELYIYKDGKVNFFEVQKRCLTSNTFKIHMMSKEMPATFTAFDILYLEDQEVMNQSLMKRKQLLKNLIKEDERINQSRYIETKGIMLYEKTKQLGLEGIVAKRKDSVYKMGKRTKDWIKCKHLIEDDYVICGYLKKEKGIISLIIGQYDNQMLVYKGHVTLGVNISYIERHTKKVNTHEFMKYKENEDAIWIKPYLVGIIKFMEYTKNNSLRQPVFKGYRDDKLPEECIVKK